MLMYGLGASEPQSWIPSGENSPLLKHSCFVPTACGRYGELVRRTAERLGGFLVGVGATGACYSVLFPITAPITAGLSAGGITACALRMKKYPAVSNGEEFFYGAGVAALCALCTGYFYWQPLADIEKEYLMTTLKICGKIAVPGLVILAPAYYFKPKGESEKNPDSDDKVHELDDIVYV